MLDRETPEGTRFCVPCALHRCAVLAPSFILLSHDGGAPLQVPLVYLVDMAHHRIFLDDFLVLGPNLHCHDHLCQQAQVHVMGDPQTWLPGS